MLFPGFTHQHIDMQETTIHLVRGGEGPPVLLLHGYPQTCVAWHRVAPSLAKHFTVVCPDLRGYGDSDKPPSLPDHSTYAKRTLARDQLEVMRRLGYDRFAVVGHDRGARVAYRMALDHPRHVTRLALLDIVPTSSVFATVNQAVATADYHWFFLIQPDGLPERMIGADPEFYLRWTLEHWSGTPDIPAPEAVAEYMRCFDTATIRASCEDYRAGATIDLAHEAKDQGRRITCPLLLLWSARGTGALYDVLSIWQERATQVQGRAMDCGHFLAEERPEETVAELLAFLSAQEDGQVENQARPPA